jgi:hypothetical protein
MVLPKNASRSLKPLRPWSKLLCVIASHLVSSERMRSPPMPKSLLYIAASLAGLSFGTNACGSRERREKGAFEASGVYDHLGRSSGVANGFSVLESEDSVRRRSINDRYTYLGPPSRKQVAISIVSFVFAGVHKFVGLCSKAVSCRGVTHGTRRRRQLHPP